MGYDISASASSSSASGAVQFGNITGGTIGTPSWVMVAIGGGVLALVAFGLYLFKK